MIENEWSKVYERRFGKKLDDEDIQGWEEEIEGEVKNCRKSEIVKAVRALGVEKRKGLLKYQVTVNNIISKILELRYQNRVGLNTEELQTRKEAEMNERKNRIRNAGTIDEKWEVICEPDKVEDCQALEEFAGSLPEGFTRPKFPSLAAKVDKIIQGWKERDKIEEEKPAKILKIPGRIGA